MKTRNVVLAVAAALGIAGLLGLQRLRTWVTEDPRFCASCHAQSPEFALWSGGSHSAVACQKCHHNSAEEGVQMLRAFLTGSQGERPHARIELGACAACHLSHDRQWAQIGASRGHRIHAIEQKISCVQCHAGGVHRFAPASASCKGCHGGQTVRMAGMQRTHCFACHDFLSAGEDLRPTRRDCLKCHQKMGLHPSRFPEQGPMRFACSACHRPHAAPGRERVSCDACHRGLAGLHLNPGHRDCARCHRPHTWASEVADCLRCHKEAASHDGRLTCQACHRWRARPQQ